MCVYVCVDAWVCGRHCVYAFVLCVCAHLVWVFDCVYGAISSWNGKTLKSVDQFIYLGSYISATESDVNICIGCYWWFIGHKKSDLSDKIKRNIYQVIAMSVFLYGFNSWTQRKCIETIQVRGTKHVGPCWRSKDELISDVLYRLLHSSALCRHLLPLRGLGESDDR